MKKSLILTGALAFASLIANAKTYDIILSSPTMVGNVQLNPGEYRLKVEGSNAQFYDVMKDKAVTVPVKIEQAPKKFGQTAVDTNNSGGTDKIQKIELGGSTTQLDFGE